MNDKIIGIIGGMGPEATADLYMKIIKETKVKEEQEHFRVIIDSNPKIPDRTRAILEKGESPVNAIVETANNLGKAGVDIGCMPCITAHYFFDEVQSQVPFKIINALEELNLYLKNNYPNIKNIGILATTGTVKTGLFNKYLTDFNIIYPDEDTQSKKVMEAIYGESGIKKGNTGKENLNLLVEATEELVDKGAKLIIGGCTEITLVLKPYNIDKPLIDPMDVVAKSIVRY
ncbi:aspartate/glutamate racemase family protein [Anaerosalibacter massiliensis]|uniref:Amino acid racemase n=1 Tax=Anaerosalibacter massiliensis TaxID=1347392 RepID=A0A9X2S3Z0_9FIRM|nr:amino acid racemase [Anaerosalibacter massiliensis]MCR2042928.1 amino acid racemase [Anaerosalibacter massiliensis]